MIICLISATNGKYEIKPAPSEGPPNIQPSDNLNMPLTSINTNRKLSSIVEKSESMERTRQRPDIGNRKSQQSKEDSAENDKEEQKTPTKELEPDLTSESETSESHTINNNVEVIDMDDTD